MSLKILKALKALTPRHYLYPGFSGCKKLWLQKYLLRFDVLRFGAFARFASVERLIKELCLIPPKAGRSRDLCMN